MITKNFVVQAVWKFLKNKINWWMIMFTKNSGNDLGVPLPGGGGGGGTTKPI